MLFASKQWVPHVQAKNDNILATGDDVYATIANSLPATNPISRNETITKNPAVTNGWTAGRINPVCRRKPNGRSGPIL